jgi:hypothetical protein
MASRSGELAMRPLPAVLLDLHEDLATGKLILKRGRVTKTVDLVNGNPVSTASTPRDVGMASTPKRAADAPRDGTLSLARWRVVSAAIERYTGVAWHRASSGTR